MTVWGDYMRPPLSIVSNQKTCNWVTFLDNGSYVMEASQSKCWPSRENSDIGSLGWCIREASWEPGFTNNSPIDSWILCGPNPPGDGGNMRELQVHISSLWQTYSMSIGIFTVSFRGCKHSEGGQDSAWVLRGSAVRSPEQSNPSSLALGPTFAWLC